MYYLVLILVNKEKKRKDAKDTEMRYILMMIRIC